MTRDFQNMTDPQFVALIGLVNQSSGFTVKFPNDVGEDLIVSHELAAARWIVNPDGTITPQSLMPGPPNPPDTEERMVG
jgi:hypothetical protein